MVARSVLLFLVAAAVTVPNAADVKRDSDNLQGEWSMVSGEASGEQIPDRVVKVISLVVKGDRFIIKGRPGTQEDEEAIFKLDPATKPKSIDLTATKGPIKDSVAKGIYSLEGKTLRICHTIPTKERPAEFKTSQGSYLFLLVFERKEAQKP